MTVSRAYRIAVSTCLTLVLLVVALWLRGLFAKDAVYWFTSAGRQLSLVSYPHHLFIGSEVSGRRWNGARPAVAFGYHSIPSRMDYLEFRFGQFNGDWRLWIPNWLIFLLLLPLPISALSRRVRHRRRRSQGLCEQCGYDLRGSGERCPECGTVINPSAQTYASSGTSR